MHKAMVFVDCPSPSYISSLARSNAFSRFQEGSEYPLHCMIHLVRRDVLEDPRYGQWLSTFGDGVHVRDWI